MVKLVSRAHISSFFLWLTCLSDADTRIPVMYGDRSGIDVSDDGEVEEGVKDEDDENDPAQVASSMPTPESLVKSAYDAKSATSAATKKLIPTQCS